ncbi:hypothetical protein [Aporhodopirellula aestuarii]|uniref:Secreted protein n=1 Tax=Aporhodopirellula aestuarii TaxID=2950107 RepID=A0ABT0UEC9_9BACT|nr:hypothetical protein [Aporhodopirellula aestuarii]MCM2375239.1 hypothetical protein [Aporhodopirellula aestuarii]
MLQLQTKVLALMASCFLLLAFVGCGGADNKVVVPEMTPEELQAEIDKRVQEAADYKPE